MKRNNRNLIILIAILVCMTAGAAGGTILYKIRTADQSAVSSDAREGSGNGTAESTEKKDGSTATGADGAGGDAQDAQQGSGRQDGSAGGGSDRAAQSGGPDQDSGPYEDVLQDNGLPEGVRDTGIAVYIEAGHGREDDGDWDSGCSWSDGSSDYEEATIILPVTQAMVHYMRLSGVRVETDADRGNDKDLEETLDYLDQHPEFAAFVNIHCDWEQAAPGTMPLYNTQEQQAMAEKLNEGVHSELQIADRGLVYRDDLQTLTSEKVHCPAVLFETGSISADNELLRTQYDSYGKGLAKGLCSYLGIPFMGDSNQ